MNVFLRPTWQKIVLALGLFVVLYDFENVLLVSFSSYVSPSDTKAIAILHLIFHMLILADIGIAYLLSCSYFANRLKNKPWYEKKDDSHES